MESRKLGNLVIAALLLLGTFSAPAAAAVAPAPAVVEGSLPAAAGEQLGYPRAYRRQPDAPAAALDILIYADDNTHPAPNTFIDQALQALGLGYTAHYDNDWAGFQTSLTGGTWDLVLVGGDMYGPPESVLTALNSYVAGGGKLVFQSWHVSGFPSHALWSTLGFTWVSDDGGPPDPVYWWQPDHPIFSHPHDVPEFTALTTGVYGIYGQHVEPLGGAEAIAGYTTPGPDADSAAMVLANDNRTVFKAFLDGQNSADLDGDTVLDGVELWINLIAGIQSGFAPRIGVTPDSLAANLVLGTSETQQLALTNTGSAPLTFDILTWDRDLAPAIADGPGLDGDTALDGVVRWINPIEGIQTGFVADISWVSTLPTSGTVPAGGSQIAVDVTFDAGAVDQPGEYGATLEVRSNDPTSGTIDIPITMTVGPPLDWGKLEGTITGLGYCDADSYPLEDATVVAQGGETMMVTTNTSGEYSAWLPEGIYDVIASANGHVDGTGQVTVAAQQTATRDLALRSLQPCMSITPRAMEATLLAGASESQSLTLTNDGAGPSEFTIAEDGPTLSDSPSLCFAYPDSLPDRLGDDVAWVAASPVTGTLPAASQLAVEVTFTAILTMPPGIYTSTLLVETQDAQAPVSRVPVTLSVISCVEVAGVVLSVVTADPVSAGEPVHMEADIRPHNTSKPYDYRVDYGDGTSPITGSSGDDPLALSHAYTSAGDYTATISVWNCGMAQPLVSTAPVTVVNGHIYLPLIRKHD